MNRTQLNQIMSDLIDYSKLSAIADVNGNTQKAVELGLQGFNEVMKILSEFDRLHEIEKAYKKLLTIQDNPV